VEDLPDLSWAEIEAIDESRVGADARAAVAAIRQRLAAAAAALALRIEEIREETGWLRLEPEEKARVRRALRDDPRFCDRSSSWVLTGLSSGEPADLLRRQFRTPRELEAADIDAG
ncbi:MAG TPA: hypothetical protein VF701_17415, partial [Thermoanaerobaculia bacterium]